MKERWAGTGVGGFLTLPFMNLRPRNVGFFLMLTMWNGKVFS